MIHLRQTTPVGDLLHEFDQPEVILGRKTSQAHTDLDLAPDAMISRTHARIRCEADGYWIEDLQSRHGTFVNGVRLGYARRLNTGDVIRLGQTELRVEELPADAETSIGETPADEQDRVEHALDAEEVSAADPSASFSHTREELQFLLELPRLLNEQADLDSLLHTAVERVVKIIPGAERGALLLTDASGVLGVRASVPAAQPAVSRSIAGRVLKEGRAFVWRRSLRGSPSESLERLGTRTGMYAPMRRQDRVVGVLCVDSTHPRTKFTTEDLRLLLAVACYAAAAIGDRK